MTDVPTVDSSDASTIRRIVDGAPQLSEATRATLAALLRGGASR